MAGRWEVTEEQWELLEPVLRPLRRKDNRGRPWTETRAVLNGVLWVLGTGAQWAEMPEKFPRTRPVIAGFRRGCATASSLMRCDCWQGTCTSEANSTWTKRSWMQPSRAPKRGLCGRSHAARQGHEDRRYRRWRRSSSRRICRRRFTCRMPACGSCFGRMLPRSTARATNRRQSLRFGRPG